MAYVHGSHSNVTIVCVTFRKKKKKKKQKHNVAMQTRRVVSRGALVVLAVWMVVSGTVVVVGFVQGEFVSTPVVRRSRIRLRDASVSSSRATRAGSPDLPVVLLGVGCRTAVAEATNVRSWWRGRVRDVRKDDDDDDDDVKDDDTGTAMATEVLRIAPDTHVVCAADDDYDDDLPRLSRGRIVVTLNDDNGNRRHRKHDDKVVRVSVTPGQTHVRITTVTAEFSAPSLTRVLVLDDDDDDGGGVPTVATVAARVAGWLAVRLADARYVGVPMTDLVRRVVVVVTANDQNDDEHPVTWTSSSTTWTTAFNAASPSSTFDPFCVRVCVSSSSSSSSFTSSSSSVHVLLRQTAADAPQVTIDLPVTRDCYTLTERNDDDDDDGVRTAITVVRDGERDVRVHPLTSTVDGVMVMLPSTTLAHAPAVHVQRCDAAARATTKTRSNTRRRDDDVKDDVKDDACEMRGDVRVLGRCYARDFCAFPTPHVCALRRGICAWRGNACVLNVKR